MVSILHGWWWWGGGSLLVLLLLLLKRVCGAYHSLSLSLQLFCISRYGAAGAVLCTVAFISRLALPLLLLYYYSLPNALAYYSRRHDAPIIHCCCKLPQDFWFVFFRIFFFALTFALKRSSQCRPASSFSLACVMYISLFLFLFSLSLPRVRERERESNDGVTDSICVSCYSIRMPTCYFPSSSSSARLSYTVHV